MACALGAAPAALAQTNLALGKVATGSTPCNSAETAPLAVNGSVSDKWCSLALSKWLQVDLGASHSLGRFVLRHAGAGGEPLAYNTRDFNIQTSTDNVGWSTAVTVAGSSASTTTHDIAARTARYVRLNVTGPEQSGGGAARLYELEVYGATGTPVPTATPTPTPSGGNVVEITPGSGAVSASANDGNLPGNTVDNSLSTRWSANGDGQWIQYDLGTSRQVAHVRLAFYNGNLRRALFDLQVSNDNTTWTNVLTGVQSSGTTTQEQLFDFPDATARYVRYVGHGNSTNTVEQPDGGQPLRRVGRHAGHSDAHPDRSPVVDAYAHGHARGGMHVTADADRLRDGASRGLRRVRHARNEHHRHRVRDLAAQLGDVRSRWKPPVVHRKVPARAARRPDRHLRDHAVPVGEPDVRRRAVRVPPSGSGMPTSAAAARCR